MKEVIAPQIMKMLIIPRYNVDKHKRLVFTISVERNDTNYIDSLLSIGCFYLLYRL